MHFLIAEDERDTRELLCSYFHAQSHRISCAENGRQALEMIENDPPEFMLLDIRMPGLDGWQVLQKIREKYQFPVLILSALAESNDAVRGLSLGADDYLRKPFEVSELDARIRAILRRSQAKQDNLTELEYLGIRINYHQKKVFYKNVELNLTPKEFKLLCILMTEPEHTYSIDEIVDYVWGSDSVATGSDVKQYVLMLRKKLTSFCQERIKIKNRKGYGYYLCEENNEVVTE